MATQLHKGLGIIWDFILKLINIDLIWKMINLLIIKIFWKCIKYLIRF